MKDLCVTEEIRKKGAFNEIRGLSYIINFVDFGLTL